MEPSEPPTVVISMGRLNALHEESDIPNKEGRIPQSDTTKSNKCRILFIFCRQFTTEIGYAKSFGLGMF
jgi:hypothetical protein